MAAVSLPAKLNIILESCEVSCPLCMIVLLLSSQGGHKPGILRGVFEHGKLRQFSGNFAQPQGKIVAE